MPAPFPVTPELQAIAIAYRNPAYIADRVLPDVPVGREDFKYWSYPTAESYALPDTKVGRRSRPNEVTLAATETTASTEDFGLEDAIPQNDIENGQAMGIDPVGAAVEQLTDYVLIDREKQVADLVFNAANYPTGFKATLSGTSQWSDTTSAPVRAIAAAMDACLMRPNVMVIGREAWTQLATHPDVMKSVNASAGDRGIAQAAAVAGVFGLEEILIGEGWLNTAKKGQAATLARIWGKHCALIHRNRLANTRGGLTFGFTAKWGQRVSGQRPDPDIGLRGGTRVRVGESRKPLIVASSAGYLFTNAVA